MQKTFALLFALFALAACNHKPVVETDVTSNEPPPIGSDYMPYDSVMLRERIQYTYFHHFSDSVEQDSFLVEMDPGNIIGGWFYFSIYNTQGALLYEDEIPAELYLGNAINDNQFTPEMIIDSLKRDLSHFLDLDNFKYAADNEAIRKARGSEIDNMVAWNEAVNDPRRMTFRYWATPVAEFHVAYSHKLSAGNVIVVKEYDE